MKRDGFPSSVPEVLRRVLARRGMERRIKELWILPQWREIVGEKISQHTQPVTVKKGNLFVRVDSSGWLTQLTYLKEKIISQINQREGSDLIKDIYFHLGEVKENCSVRENIQSGKIRNKLDKKDWVKIRENLVNLKDSSLRKTVKRILIREIMSKKPGQTRS